jgi:hypothetical protein
VPTVSWINKKKNTFERYILADESCSSRDVEAAAPAPPNACTFRFRLIACALFHIPCSRLARVVSERLVALLGRSCRPSFSSSSTC